MIQEIPRLYTPEELADHLGVSVKYVRNLCRTGQIPHTKVGQRFWFRREDLLTFLDRTRVCA